MDSKFHRLVGYLLLLAVIVVGGVVVPAPTGQAQDADDELEFIQPTNNRLSGVADLEVEAPEGTTAVRFYVDDVRLSELTDLYAEQTKTEPVWKTATDAGWFEPGEHVLRAEADTPSGTVSAERSVTTQRPQPPRGRLSITGGWGFAAEEDLPAGSAEGEKPAATQPGFEGGNWTRVMVPNSLGAVDERWNGYEGILGVYRKTVDLDAPESGERTAISLESCYFSCRVFVNGEEVGETRGGYLPSRFDVTGAVRPGDNLVAVVADYRRSTMGELSRIHDFYWNWGGILQEVYIERTPRVALTDLRAEGDRDGRLTLHPTGVNGTDMPQRVNAVVEVNGPGGARAVASRRVSTILPAGGGQAEPIVLRVSNPALWDLEEPNLYTVTLRGPGGALRERTGFRDVSVSGGDVLLNGEVVENLQGFNRHADYPGLGRTQPDGLARREMRELHEKGFRIFRPAHYPTTPAELDAADELGMLVIEEINVSGLTGGALASPKIKDFGADQLTKMIRRDRSHPSVIAWSVGNENLTEQVGAPEYVRDTIAVGRSDDPTRLYTQVTHRGTRDRTYGYQDLIAHNYYAGWYTGDASDIVDLLDSVQTYAGGKPIMLSEYGAEAVIGRPGTGKGTEFFQSYIVDEHNRLLDDRENFLGKMYWTSTEFWCRPDWGGGNPDPIPPFHAKAVQGLYRDYDKLGWRVMFSPVRLSGAMDVISIADDGTATLRQSVQVNEVRGEGASGTVVVEVPEGYTADPVRQPFRVEPNGVQTVEVTLRGKAPDPGERSQGFVRAVMDEDTEAQPLQIRGVEVTDTSAGLMVGGQTTPVTASLVNNTNDEVSVKARLRVPDGWKSETASATLAPSSSTDVRIGVTPPAAVLPSNEELVLEIDGGLPVSGERTVQVVTAPSGDSVSLALDSGRPGSPLFDTYERLSPLDAWDPAKGYGWVGDSPSDRDRGLVDALRRDFTLSRDPATLRLYVPAGVHNAYLLRGDASFSSGDTIVSSEGQVLANGGATLSSGEFEWIPFQLDGGPDGRTVDLVVSGESGNYWRLNSLVVLP